MNLDLNSVWFFYPGGKTKSRVASGCNLFCEYSQKLPGRVLRESRGAGRAVAVTPTSEVLPAFHTELIWRYLWSGKETKEAEAGICS